MDLPSNRRRAFTLIELLAVITIIAILLALGGTVSVSVMRASQISTEVSSLADVLTRASLDAVRTNRPIQFRLYRFADEVNSGQPLVRAYQTLLLDAESRAFIETGPLHRLPDGISIHEEITASTLLSLPERTPLTNPSSDPLAVTDPELKGIAPYTYYGFEFRPDGSTNLPKDANWGVVITSMTGNTSGTTSGVPKDYRALGINPFTGAVKKY